VDVPFVADSRTGVHVLYDLLASPADWTELHPNAINDYGQIVGYGRHRDYNYRAFLMSPIFADFNGNARMDLADHEVFSGCLGGPAQVFPEGCLLGDVDRNGSIDLADFRVIQWRLPSAAHE
jgi:probable HAF family extracellular repeat protein